MPTFDGPVAVKVPPGTSSGTVLRLRGEGVVRKGREPGDLYARFMIKLPRIEGTLPPELDRLLAEVEKVVPTEDVRAGLEV